jgi:hypothetical protein
MTCTLIVPHCQMVTVHHWLLTVLSNGIGLPFPEKPVDNPASGPILPIVNIPFKEEQKSQ